MSSRRSWASFATSGILFVHLLAVLLLAADAKKAGAKKDDVKTGFLRGRAPVSNAVIERELFANLGAHLAGGGSAVQGAERARRVGDLEDLLRPTFAALPKDKTGRLGHWTVRYLLHRYFMQRYSWFIRGLEPDTGHAFAAPAASSAQANFTVGSAAVLPSLLQADLERLGEGGAGLDLHEVASLAATLEDVVRFENLNRLEMAYDFRGLSTTATLNHVQADAVISDYSMLFNTAWNMSSLTHEYLRLKEERHFRLKWWQQELHPWLERLTHEILVLRGKVESAMSFDDVSSVAHEVGKNFQQLNTPECDHMKEVLLSIEDRKLGRVRLSDFYNRSKYSKWRFWEKIEYLRTLGALDETNASNPLVLITNYVMAMPQCLKASSLYLVCCPNECDTLMSNLEQQVAAPEGDPKVIAQLVGQMTTATVLAPRKLSNTLVERLQEVADYHGGRVPLHGRPFALWMHHAFPRECPSPHKDAVPNPQTPDEWIQDTGHSDASASEAEMDTHIRPDESCPASLGPAGCRPEGDLEVELPWHSPGDMLRTTVGAEASIASDVASGMEEVKQLLDEADLFQAGATEAVADDVAGPAADDVAARAGARGGGGGGGRRGTLMAVLVWVGSSAASGLFLVLVAAPLLRGRGLLGPRSTLGSLAGLGGKVHDLGPGGGFGAYV